MALTTSLITGRVPLPTDAAPIWAEVVFTLVGHDTEGDQALPGGAHARIALTATGDLPAGKTLWRNTAGLRGTSYQMEVYWKDRDRQGDHIYLYDFGRVQVGDNASYTVAELLNATPVPLPTATYWTSLTQAEYDAAIDAADRAEAVGIFDTDAIYAAWDATNTPVNNRLYLIAGRPYRGQTAAAVIPGRSGLIPWQFDGRTDIRQLGGIGSGADETSSFQALYDAGAHGSAARISKGNAAWQCASPVVLSGSKRLFYEVDTDADFTSETDFLNAIPEYSNNTGQKFLRNKHFSIAIAGSGGVEEWSTRFLPSDPLVAGQKDGFRQTGVMLDPSEGTSWGTAGANVNHDMVIHTPVAFVMGAHNRHSAFTINPSMYYFAGADGQGRVVEGNLWMDAATALVTSMTDVRQKGVFAAILKPGSQSATYAYTFGGGTFVKGFFATQASLLNHTDTRFIQLENFFNVYRTGLMVGGKAASSLYSAGYELNATGEFFLTANAVSALQILARQDQLTGSPLVIGSIQARGLNTAAVQKVFSEIQLVSQDGTSGLEDGGVVFLTALAGSAASERIRIREGLSIAGGQQKTRMTYTSHTVSFASMTAGTGTSVTITVSGVLAGDGIAITLSNALASLNLVYRWARTATDTITIYAYNPTAGTISPAAGASVYVETTRYVA